MKYNYRRLITFEYLVFPHCTPILHQIQESSKILRMVRRDLLEGNQFESLRDMQETKTFPFAAQPGGLRADGGTSALGVGQLLLPALFPDEERQQMASRTQDAMARTALPQEALFQALRKIEVVSKSLFLTGTDSLKQLILT